MEISSFIDLFLHLDKHLADLVIHYGSWVYGILTIIVFCETGLVIAPKFWMTNPSEWLTFTTSPKSVNKYL